jgi:hypothetical protein
MAVAVSPLAEALRKRIALQPGERLYGIVDAAQDKDMAFEARDRFKLPIRMLFQGEAAQYMGEVAPYFIPIDPQSEYLESWASRWGKNVGILLTSSADPLKLFRHLREVFVVKDEEGQEHFFRFYDPRVLRTYLPTCTPEEVRAFFGPANALLSEGAKPNTLLRYTVGREGLSQASIEIPMSDPMSVT